MKYTVQDVLQYVESEDVKFIRLAFCDETGRQKNLAIMPAELPRAFERGAAVTFGGREILLRPDPATLTQMPWRPQQGRVVHLFCDLAERDGSPCPEDARRLLRENWDETWEIEVELPFTLYPLQEDGTPASTPFDRGGWLDVAPLDRGENLRREICLTLEQMGLLPWRSHHGEGPGENLVKYQAACPVKAGDDLVLFRDLVRAVSAQNGLFADFSGARLQIRVRGGGTSKVFAELDGEGNPYALLDRLLAQC